MIDILSIFNVTNPVPILLSVIAFFSGAAVMLIELVGTRIIAPYVGTSIYIWTALIGVIMTSLTIGYTFGGRLADRRPNLRVLALILFCASLSTAGIIVIRHSAYIFGILTSEQRLTSLLTAVMLFAPSTVLLGMVTPYVARLSLSTVATSGKTIGTLYALSTAGSILGTFAGGFVLISLFGSSKIILGTALLLLALSALTGIMSSVKGKSIATLLGIFFILYASTVPNDIPVPGTLILDRDTPYRRAWVFDGSNIENKISAERARYFTDTIFGYESGVLLDKPSEILFNYVKYFDLATYFNPTLKRELMIGAGTFTYPTHFVTRYPDKTIDAIEIDPQLLTIAKEFFFYTDNPRLNPIHEDGRVFLNHTSETYDAIIMDAFSSVFTIPFQLSTKEAISHIYSLLTENGVVFVNIITSIDGPRGDFLRAEYATYRSIFPNVYVFQVRDDRRSSDTQNLILVALKSVNGVKPPFTSSDPVEQALLDRYYAKPIALTEPILTDDFAPVEKYVAKMMANN